MKKLNILVYGAGAVGLSILYFLKRSEHNVTLIARGETVELIGANGVSVYDKETGEKVTFQVSVSDNFDHVKEADIIFLAVKCYDLDQVVANIHSQLNTGTLPDSNTSSRKPILVSLQNGHGSLEKIAKYTEHVVQCIVSYNAWLDDKRTVGYQLNGGLTLGSLKPEQSQLALSVADIFGTRINVKATDRIQDAMHSKLLSNLSNSVNALTGNDYSNDNDIKAMQIILTNLLWEGTKVLHAADIKEYSLGVVPSWKLVSIAKYLPWTITRPQFRKNLKKMVISSMAQDILQNKRTDTELEDINGYLVDLAERHQVAVPFNQAVLDICREHFHQDGFSPIGASVVLKLITDRLENKEKVVTG